MLADTTFINNNCCTHPCSERQKKRMSTKERMDRSPPTKTV